jgi:hypothetical protein
LSVELVNGLIKRTEYAADLLRQYKLVGIPSLFNGTIISEEEVGLSRDLPDIVGTATIGGRNFGFRLSGTGLRDPNTSLAQGQIFTAPNSFQTNFFGADGSDIVGSATTNQGIQGFLLQGSTYTFFTMPSVPSSTRTEAVGVRAQQIVGFYQRGPLSVAGATRGFLFDGSTFTDIFVPGSFLTVANGIEGSDIVGSFFFPGGAVQGFLYNGSNFTFLNPPGSTFTQATGISGLNIVGNCVVGGITKGYFYNSITGQFTIFEVPESTSTVANGIKDTTIVGQTVIGGITKGFILGVTMKGDGTFFRSLSILGATSTRAADLA